MTIKKFFSLTMAMIAISQYAIATEQPLESAADQTEIRQQETAAATKDPSDTDTEPGSPCREHSPKVTSSSDLSDISETELEIQIPRTKMHGGTKEEMQRFTRIYSLSKIITAIFELQLNRYLAGVQRADYDDANLQDPLILIPALSEREKATNEKQLSKKICQFYAYGFCKKPNPTQIPQPVLPKVIRTIQLYLAALKQEVLKRYPTTTCSEFITINEQQKKILHDYPGVCSFFEKIQEELLATALSEIMSNKTLFNKTLQWLYLAKKRTGKEFNLFNHAEWEPIPFKQKLITQRTAAPVRVTIPTAGVVINVMSPTQGGIFVNVGQGIPVYMSHMNPYKYSLGPVKR